MDKVEAKVGYSIKKNFKVIYIEMIFQNWQCHYITIWKPYGKILIYSNQVLQ